MIMIFTQFEDYQITNEQQIKYKNWFFLYLRYKIEIWVYILWRLK